MLLYHVRQGKAVRGHHNGIFYIANVYQEIQKQMAAGNVILRRFEEHSNKEIQEYYQHFTEYLHERKGKMSEKELDFYRLHFPRCIE